jgi:hypothetical protein
MITPEEKKAFNFLKKYALSNGNSEIEFSFEYEYNPNTDVDVSYFTTADSRGSYGDSLVIPQSIAVKILEFYNRELKDKIEDVWNNFPGDDELPNGGMNLRFNFNISEVFAMVWADYYSTADEEITTWKSDGDSELTECIKDLKSMDEETEQMMEATLDFSGGGDSGYIEDDMTTNLGTYTAPESCKDYMYHRLPGGWEINEGSQGSGVFDVIKGTFTLFYTENIEGQHTNTIFEESF